MSEQKMINYGSRTNQNRIKETEEELERLLKRPEPEEEVEEKEEEETKEEAKEEDKELTAEERNWKKRYSDLRRREQELLKQLEAEKEKAQSPDLPTSEEDLEQWKKDHPKVYARVEAIAQKIAETRLAQQEDKFKALEEKERKSKIKEAQDKIKEAHSDYEQIRNDDAFHEWAGEQPKWIQDALYENEDDAASVIKLLKLYKIEAGIEEKKPVKKDKSAMSSVKGGRSTPDSNASLKGDVIKESDIAKMSMKEFEKRFDEIEEARRSGKIIYDLRK